MALQERVDSFSNGANSSYKLIKLWSDELSGQLEDEVYDEVCNGRIFAKTD